MADLKLSKNIYVTAADGKCYRHKVTCTPPATVEVTHGKRWQSLKFWKKEQVTERVPLKMTEGSLWWKEEVDNPEAVKALAEYAHDLGLAHITQYGKDFQEVIIDGSGAKFDKNPAVQGHNFSVIDDSYKAKMAKASNEPGATKFIDDLKTAYHRPKSADIKAGDLFRRFAGVAPVAALPPPSRSLSVSSHGSSDSDSSLSSSPHRVGPPSPGHVSPVPTPPHSPTHGRRSPRPRPLSPAHISSVSTPRHSPVHVVGSPGVVAESVLPPDSPVEEEEEQDAVQSKADELTGLFGIFRRQVGGNSSPDDEVRIAALQADQP